jgi:hypothetical protein
VPSLPDRMHGPRGRLRALGMVASASVARPPLTSRGLADRSLLPCADAGCLPAARLVVCDDHDQVASSQRSGEWVYVLVQDVSTGRVMTLEDNRAIMDAMAKAKTPEVRRLAAAMRD